MSETRGANPVRADSATGGTPTESDLPSMQGLGESADSPNDPTASRRQAQDSGQNAVPDVSDGEMEAASDSMPDGSGTTGP